MRKLILTAVALVVVTIVIVYYMETGNATVVQWANKTVFTELYSVQSRCVKQATETLSADRRFVQQETLQRRLPQCIMKQ